MGDCATDEVSITSVVEWVGVDSGVTESWGKEGGTVDCRAKGTSPVIVPFGGDWLEISWATFALSYKILSIRIPVSLNHGLNPFSFKAGRSL